MNLHTAPHAAAPPPCAKANQPPRRRRPFAAGSTWPALLAALILIAPTATAQVQATPKNSREFIATVCINAMNDRGREAIAQRGKDLASVCDCTADRMWAAFPSIYFWVQETTPYEQNLIVEEFPKAMTGCIVD